MARLFVLSAFVFAASLSPASAQEPSKQVKKLEKELKDKDPAVRAEAAWDLGRLGARESVPALTAALEQDSFGAVRANAAASLWKLGAASRPAMPALEKALDDPFAPVVGNAAGALAELGVPKSRLVPAYRRLLHGLNCEARVVGLKGLVGEVPPTELFDGAFDCSQASGDFEVRRDAGQVLRKLIDPKNREMVPVILDTLRTIGSRDASDLTMAIVRYQPPVTEAVPVLAKLLGSRHEKNPRFAAKALGQMGEAALPAVPEIIALLNSTTADAETRENAAEALGDIGPAAAREAVPALMKTAQADKWPKVRKAAISALGEMGPAAKDAVPALRAALKDPDGFISMAARNALFRLEPDKRQEVADIRDKARPVETGSLFDDLSQLASTLPGQVPEVYELIIYEKFAMATVPWPESRNGRSKFKYQAGTVTGPEEAIGGDCKKKLALAKVNFTVVPGLIKQAPGLVGAPSGKVSHVALSGGVFCHNLGWLVYVERAGFVMFRLDGKVEKVQKL